MNKPSYYRNSLTNELPMKKFRSQFELVREAIRRAEYRIQSGHGETSIEEQNLASEVLEEIAEEAWKEEEDSEE